MDVTGVPVEKVLDLYGQLIESATINPETGNLELKRRNGQVINAGLVKPKGIDIAYPIGAIFTSISPTNPGTILGGEWVQWGKGKVIVGQDGADGDFTPAEKTGGSKTVGLGIENMPNHSHGGSIATSAAGAYNAYTLADTPDHGHFTNMGAFAVAAGPNYRVYGPGGSENVGSNGANARHTHYYGIPDHQHTVTLTAQGGGVAHANVQPYVVAYFWKRTA